MSMPLRGQVTELLRAWSQGEKAAADRLMPLVYDEPRQRAAAALRPERPSRTLTLERGRTPRRPGALAGDSGPLRGCSGAAGRRAQRVAPDGHGPCRRRCAWPATWRTASAPPTRRASCVWVWTLDHAPGVFKPAPYDGHPRDGSPRLGWDGSARIIRGSGWDFGPTVQAVWVRDAGSVYGHGAMLGVRCVRDTPP
jgi:hypothetical protein